MYRLVLYYLLLLYVAALTCGVLGLLPYAPISLLYSLAILIAAAWVGNIFFAWFFDATTNHESSLITGLILALILQPVIAGDAGGAVLLSLIALFAVASKFVLSIERKHIFNPAAFAVAVSVLAFGTSATWWVGGNTALLLPALLGVVIVYKIRRFDLVIAFFIAAIAAVAYTSSDAAIGLHSMFVHAPIFFLAFVMLTEPLTMPPTRSLRIIYGVIVGLLFAPAAHIGSLYSSPELALLVGNVFAFFVSPKGRHVLTLVGRKKKADGIYEFIFRPDHPFDFRPGQYLEWTLAKVPFDSRGNRRFFTIASAPGEDVALGVRFYENPSGFKRRLAELPPNGTISAATLAGDFTLPKNAKKKLAFIAGGVGVTPFVSMTRHMTKTGEKRDAVLLYSSKTAEEVAYQEVFTAAAPFGLRTEYALTDQGGMIDAAYIKRAIPDYRERLFYLSGPPGMVDAMKRTLGDLSVSRFAIKTDYFPGLT